MDSNEIFALAMTKVYEITNETKKSSDDFNVIMSMMAIIVYLQSNNDQKHRKNIVKIVNNNLLHHVGLITPKVDDFIEKFELYKKDLSTVH